MSRELLRKDFPAEMTFGLSAGDLGWISGSGRSPGEGNDNPLEYSCLENSMDRGAWRTAIYGIAKNRTLVSDFHFSLSSFTFIKRLFSSSSLPVISVVSSAYLRLLIFLLASLIPVYDSSSSAFHIASIKIIVVINKMETLRTQANSLQSCPTLHVKCQAG